MMTNTNTKIGYASIRSGSRCPHVHATEASAERCGGWADEVNLPDALSMARVPWARIAAAGHDLEEIADVSRAYGDEVLYRRAVAAARGRR